MAKGLGSGLGALFGEELLREPDAPASVPVAKIEPRPGQPRTVFDEERLRELADSIREHGLIQPVTVRKLDGGYYQIIAGERRWRAARMAGLSEIPVNIIEADDQKAGELALIENLQREDLNPVEEARGYKALMDAFHMTQETVAQRVGKSRPVVANALRLLKLPEQVLALVEAQKLSLSHARAILELEDSGAQLAAAEKAVEGDLSVRETTALVKRMAAPAREKPKKNPRVAADGVDYVAEVERELSHLLGRRVRIEAGEKRGKVEIEYYGAEDFERLYAALKKLKGGGR